MARRHRGGQHGAKAPPAKGLRRHGWLPNFGLSAPQANYLPRRHRPIGMPWWTWRVPHRRRPRLPGLVVTSGPFYMVAGQVYVAGAVDGIVETTS